MTAGQASLDAVLTHVEGHRDAFLARLVDYLRQPSISALDVGIAETAQCLVGTFERLGFSVDCPQTPGHPVVVARRDDVPGAPTVLLYGHYDVQPVDPLGEWTTPPFEPDIRGGRIYARGAGDNKGQHLAQILAVESWLAVHGSLPCNVVFLLEGEEEVGSPHLAGFVERHRHMLQADLAVTADGTRDPSGAPTLKMGVRGLVAFELRAKGASRDVHSGNLGGVVPNPLWTLVRLLATMRDDDGHVTIEGFNDAVLPASALDRAAVARLPSDPQGLAASLGLAHFDAPRERGYLDRLMFHPTLTVNGLHGGYGGPGLKTVIPCEAVAKCDARLVADQDPAEILRCIRAHVARHAPEVDVIALASVPSSKTPLDNPFMPAVLRAIETGQGGAPLVYPVTGGSLPDHVFTRILGIPAFVTPYSDADQCNHAPDENITIAGFLGGIRTGAALLGQLGAMRR